jgi:hypothetical protein
MSEGTVGITLARENNRVPIGFERQQQIAGIGNRKLAIPSVHQLPAIDLDRFSGEILGVC